jgi:hypothetical protein
MYKINDIKTVQQKCLESMNGGTEEQIDEDYKE